MIKRVNTGLLIMTPCCHSISDVSFSVFLSLLSVSLLLNWVPRFTAFKISTHKCSCKGKLPFIQTASNLGTWRVSQIRSDQSLSCVRLFATPWIAARQASCPSPTPGVHSDSCPLIHWCHPAISSSVVPFFSCPQSFPASGYSPWVNSSHQVAKVLEFQL